jgi:hypothetical protein
MKVIPAATVLRLLGDAAQIDRLLSEAMTVRELPLMPYERLLRARSRAAEIRNTLLGYAIADVAVAAPVEPVAADMAEQAREFAIP